jgi:hypothetical protein
MMAIKEKMMVEGINPIRMMMFCFKNLSPHVMMLRERYQMHPIRAEGRLAET